MSDRRLGPALTREDVPEVGVGAGLVRVDRERLLVRARRAFEVARGGPDVADPDVCIHQARPGGESCLVVLGGRCEPRRAGEGVREGQVGLGEAGLDAHGLGQVLDALVDGARVHQGEA